MVKASNLGRAAGVVQPYNNISIGHTYSYRPSPIRAGTLLFSISQCILLNADEIFL